MRSEVCCDPLSLDDPTLPIFTFRMLAQPGDTLSERCELLALARHIKIEAVIPGVITGPGRDRDNSMQQAPHRHTLMEHCAFGLLRSFSRRSDAPGVRSSPRRQSIHRDALRRRDLIGHVFFFFVRLPSVDLSSALPAHRHGSTCRRHVVCALCVGLRFRRFVVRPPCVISVESAGPFP